MIAPNSVGFSLLIHTNGRGAFRILRPPNVTQPLNTTHKIIFPYPKVKNVSRTADIRKRRSLRKCELESMASLPMRPGEMGMRSKFLTPSGEKGAGMIFAVLSLTGVAALGSYLFERTSMNAKANESLELRQELKDLNQALRSRVSCSTTLAAFGTTRPTTCNGPVNLLDSAGSPLTGKKGKIGRWTVTSRCEEVKGIKGLSVYASLVDSDGKYRTDPANPKLTLDEKSPISQIYAANERLCKSFFDTSSAFTRCPPELPIAKGIRFDDETLKCEKSVSVPLSSYISQVISPTEACGSTHNPSVAICPSGWIAAGCGYVLSTWNPKGKGYHSNAPDVAMPQNFDRCVVIAGGQPGKGVCFKAYANCLSVGRIANGR
jgi:hypothetical protein